MVTAVGRRTDGNRSTHSPLIVELVGPAGVGKTTVAQTLSRRTRAVRLVPLPYYRSIKQVPFFARHTVVLLPAAVVAACRHVRGWPGPREMAWMVILEGWPSALRRPLPEAADVLLLDQGPVFLLAALDAFGPAALAGQKAQGWWARMYRRWAATLDMVVWLDAPDDVCASRIRRREQWHIVKDEPAEAIFAFQARFRAAYEQVIARLTAVEDGPRILCLDTGASTPDEVVDRILSACGLDHGCAEMER